MMPSAARRSSGGARDRILKTASRLFYKEGIQAVGVDRVIAEAEVAKATLYRHFRSKDELVRVYLEGRDRPSLDFIRAEAERRAATPIGQLLAIFDWLGEWFVSDSFRGCEFMNASLELAAADHPAHLVVAQHKDGMQQLLAELLERAGAGDADHFAAQLLLLFDGATAQAVMKRNAAPAGAARAAAEIILERALSKTSPD